MESILERFGSCTLHRRLALRAAPPHRAPLSGCLVPPLGKFVFPFGLAKGKYAGAYLCMFVCVVVLRPR